MMTTSDVTNLLLALLVVLTFIGLLMGRLR